MEKDHLNTDVVIIHDDVYSMAIAANMTLTCSEI